MNMHDHIELNTPSTGAQHDAKSATNTIHTAPPQLKARYLLVGIFSGLIALALVIINMPLILSFTYAHSDNRIYSYIYSQQKSRSVAINKATQEANSYLAFGSSEFFIHDNQTPDAPDGFYGKHNRGFDLNLIGIANDQCLSQGIAMGAYQPASQHRKIFFFLSPQWFFKYNGGQAAMGKQLSFSLYKQFVHNPNISQESKDYVRKRLQQLKKTVSPKFISAANGDTPIDTLNGILMEYEEQMKILFDWSTIAQKALVRTPEKQPGSPIEVPQWDERMKQAVKRGDANGGANRFGFRNAVADKIEANRAWQDQTLNEAAREEADFQHTLRIARECGYEPLVIFIPFKGVWCDELNIPKDQRTYLYEKLKQLCDLEQVSYADFSSFEYEKYFILDSAHPGWTGWVRINNAIWDFIHDTKDEYLGGYKYGEAKGAAAIDDAGTQRMKQDGVLR